VSVGAVIPVHGFAPYLAEALDGVLAQEPAPAEVVVVDDGSPEPLALHPDHAGRARLLRRERRGGEGAARESGARAIGPQVDLIALCDADDAWEPGRLRTQIDALDHTPDVAVCFGRALIVGADGRETGERWAEPAPGRHAGAAFVAQLYAANPIPVSSALVRRDAARRAGGFAAASAPLAQDWDLWLRLAAAGEAFLCVPEAVVRYRRHPEGLSADVAALAASQLALHESHAGLVDERGRRRARRSDRSAIARARVRAALRR
jgi:GT2 family glycosyltransferase